MTTTTPRLAALCVLLLAGAAAPLAGCSRKAPPAAPAAGAYVVYVTNERSGDLTVIDPATRRATATIPLGKRPRGLRLGPDGKTLYIALSGSPIGGPGVDEDKLPPPDKQADGVAVFDVASGKIARVIKGVSDPEQLAVSKDGRVYVASEDTGKAVVLDAASGATLAQVDVGEEPEGVNLSPDGKQVWITSEGQAQVTVLDTTSFKPLKTIPVGQRPRNTAFTPDGKRAFVAGEQDHSLRVIDTATFAVLNTVTLPGDALKPMDIVVSPDGARLYVSTGRGGEVLALDAASLGIVGTAKVGARPWGIALSPDGKLLYSANGPSNDVSVVDAATMKTLAAIPAGAGPWTVAVVPKP